MTKKRCARREHNKLLVTDGEQMALMGLIQVKLSNIAFKSWQPVMPVQAMPGICQSTQENWWGTAWKKSGQTHCTPSDSCSPGTHNVRLFLHIACILHRASSEKIDHGWNCVQEQARAPTEDKLLAYGTVFQHAGCFHWFLCAVEEQNVFLFYNIIQKWIVYIKKSPAQNTKQVV